MKTKVLDTFLFTHEFDLLELRLRALWNHVDTFILMEGDHNFANKPKTMRFHEQKDRFEWAKEKLIVIQHVGKFKDYEGEISIPGELYVEHQHRQYLYDTVRAMSFSPDDIMLISDIDEIPSREILEEYKNGMLGDGPVLLKQDFYYYNIKCHRGKRWDGTIVTKFGTGLEKYNHDIGNARGNRNNMPYRVTNAGWHFAHFYDVESIREKMLHSSHQGYNVPEFNDPKHIERCIKENINYLGKPDGDLPPEPIPDYMMEELNRFPIFMGEVCQ